MEKPVIKALNADSEQIADLTRRLTVAEVERDAYRKLLEKTVAKYDDIDNGSCAVCRIGHRLSDGKGNLGICEWQDCLSHEWREALQNIRGEKEGHGRK